MQSFLKRLLDIMVSSISIFVFFPVWVLIFIAIKADSHWKDSVVYLHKRVGKGGGEFTCYKFRTMYVGSDPNVLAKNSGDERITLVGKFLRKTSLDETLQLINVLNGSMSIVGPRPALPSQVKQFTGTDFDKLLVKPGITGWTQISGRNALDYKKRMELDCWYARNWNILIDLFILLKTPFVIFKQDGIYNAK